MSIENLKFFQKENFRLFSPKNTVRDFCAFSGQNHHVLGTQTRPDSQNSGSDTAVTTVRSTFPESESKIVCFGGSPDTAMQNKPSPDTAMQNKPSPDIAMQNKS